MTPVAQHVINKTVKAAIKRPEPKMEEMEMNEGDETNTNAVRRIALIIHKSKVGDHPFKVRGTILALRSNTPTGEPQEFPHGSMDMGHGSSNALESEEPKFPGKHKHSPDSVYDPIQLKMGIEVEKEHTDCPMMAKEIAKDHLAEIPDYYTRLKKMEREAKMGIHE